MKRLVSCILCCLLTALGLFAQKPPVLTPPPVPCPTKDVYNKPPVPYANVREADVMWAKRIWRTIDLREKINQPLYYPLEPSQCRISLFDLIKEGIKSGEITAYDRPLLDDEFNYPMTLTQTLAMLTVMDTVYVQNVTTGMVDTVPMPREITSNQVTRYWVKEDWFFDRQRSVMEVRIIGLAPLIEKIDQNTGEFRGYQPLFWVYYPECRNVFCKRQVLYHTSNTSMMPSFDDVFTKRIFSSYIHKESNVYDRFVVEYKNGLDALLESDAIREKIFNMEQDLWQY
jgi:gliding motility associated protien GldN